MRKTIILMFFLLSSAFSQTRVQSYPILTSAITVETEPCLSLSSEITFVNSVDLSDKLIKVYKHTYVITNNCREGLSIDFSEQLPTQAYAENYRFVPDILNTYAFYLAAGESERIEFISTLAPVRKNSKAFVGHKSSCKLKLYVRPRVSILVNIKAVR